MYISIKTLLIEKLADSSLVKSVTFNHNLGDRCKVPVHKDVERHADIGKYL